MWNDVIEIYGLSQLSFLGEEKSRQIITGENCCCYGRSDWTLSIWGEDKNLVKSLEGKRDVTTAQHSLHARKSVRLKNIVKSQKENLAVVSLLYKFLLDRHDQIKKYAGCPADWRVETKNFLV